MTTQDFILNCIGCYHSACTYMDDLCEAFDIELTEDDVRDAIQIADYSHYQIGNVLIQWSFDKIVAEAQEAHPECADELPDLFQYYCDDYASSLVFDGEKVVTWGSLEKAIEMWKANRKD